MAKPKTAKLFVNGNSQAVRLPREFRFEGNEVYIRKEGDHVILSPKRRSWRDFFETVPLASADFILTRHNDPSQTREDLF
ncbi:antitoxin [Candidatus Synechococcus calcipolaris G9]|uniref:Antitoxin n=1 Tax=Candidatus Synechococcus calcipolaris G9 TaxID=1497997 RepID=A0ABT6EUG9_9SYNE|nr:type II toxin-antitoxin system VapB family antitoxin [Candidatus Synechococcus calcipolaris]MDG2989515.1 antitoxin [Candidatus Synechococcus calcipolaris G9]